MRKILKFIILILTNLIILTSCSPKAHTVWCFSLTKDKMFSFGYVVGDETFDGTDRIFNVKDESDFTLFLTNLDEYVTKIEKNEYIDESYIFLKDNEKYVCSKISDNKYKLSPCLYRLYTNDSKEVYYIPFIPLKNSNQNYDKIYIGFCWDDLKKFYEDYENIYLNDDEKSLEVPLYSQNKQIKTIKLKYYDTYITYEV